MSPNSPDQANVDAEQRRLDRLDQKEDRKIDVGQSERTPEDLGQTYLEKTNDLQGKIRDLQRQADVLRDKRDPGWQQLENACKQTEQGLLSTLKTIDGNNVVDEAEAFAAKVLTLSTGLDATNTEVNTPREDVSEKPVPEPMQKTFETLLKPTDDVGRATCAELAAEAALHYDAGDIRLVQSRIEMFAAMPKELVAVLFPEQQVPSGKDVAYQLARGLLESSPNAFLLSNPGPEDVVRSAREAGIDELNGVQTKLTDAKTRLENEYEGLAARTSESSKDDQIARNVAIIQRAQENIRELETQLQGIGARVTVLDLALVRMNVSVARSSGRVVDANRTLMRVQEQYGETLKTLDPSLAAEAEDAEKNTTLTPVEQAMNDQGGRSIDVAVEEAKESAAAADIVDQVQARTVARFGAVTSADNFFKGKTVRNSLNADATTYFKRYSYVSVFDGTGNRKTIAVTAAAKQRIESFPRGAKPVLLKAVESVTFRTEGGGRGGVMSYKYTGTNFENSVLDAKDIGTATNAGGALDAEGKPIDMANDPRGAIAREQIGKQRSFRMEDYAVKPAAALKKPDGTPYDKRLLTIRTAAGKTYEGVTITTDALAALERPAPDGMTLVLKREPSNIVLGAPDTERTSTGGRGGGSRAIRRVLMTDMITMADLGYAKINGDELTTTSVTDPTKTETASVTELQREREEDGRDILRAMDQSEAIKSTTSAAGQIGESLTHLQKLLTAGGEGTKRQAMVDFARAEAEPMLRLLRDANTRRNVDVALGELRALKEANLGVALGGVERDIDARIKSLEDFSKMLQSDQVANIFETIMDKSKFDADTWARWLSTELPKILAAIAVATAVIVTIIASCGTAAPLWAIAAGGAAGGLIGSQLGAEAVHLGRHLLDSDVRSGRLAYSNRSRLFAYLEGQEVIDPVTGKKVPLEFIKDVASPYAQEFAFSFVTTYAALGLGSIVASRLSALAQNSQWVQGLATRSPMANRVMTYLSQVGDDAARVGAEKSSFIKTWFRESIDELQDEFIREKGVEAVLAQVDKRLGPCAAFLVTVARGFKPMKVPNTGGNYLGSFTVQGVTDMPTLELAVQSKGYPKVENAGDHLIVTDHEGKTFEVRLDGAAAVNAEAGTTPEAASTQSEVTVESSTETKSEATAQDIQSNMETNNVGLIGARNRTGASPEVTQEAAQNLVNDRVQLARNVANPVTRAEAVARYNALLEAQGGKALSEDIVVQNCAKFEQVVAAIENGNTGIEGKYVGSPIRDLGKLMPGIDMEAKQALMCRLHEAGMKNENKARESRGEEPFTTMDEYMEWFLSPDQTIVGGRPVTPEGNFDAKDSVQLGTNPEVSTRMSDVVDAMITLANDPNATFTSDQVQQILEANPNLDSVDRTVILETAKILEGIEAKAGEASLPAAERWKILEFSARYVQDFRASPDFNATPQQLLNLVAENAVNLGHQNIMDHMTLVGSSHGTLHVLRGNSEMLNSLYGQMGFTPAMRVLAMQATFDHDMGYTKRSLVGKTPGDGVFDSSKDHPLESTLRVESRQEAYQQIFGREGYITIRNAVLDHSDPMGKGDKQYENYSTKLDIIADQNAPMADRVAAAVALVDCLATVSNLKASPLFKNNPEIVATMARIGQIHGEINALCKPVQDAAEAKAREQGLQGKDVKNAGESAVKAFRKSSPEVAALVGEAKSMRLAMQQRIEQMENIPAETRQAYLTSLDSTMQWEGSDFAIVSNLGMLAASVSPDLVIDGDGKIHASYTVDINGLATIAQALDAPTAARAATSGIMKAADDFGGFTAESQNQLKTFVMHAGNMESSDPALRQAAEAYFAENNGTLSLPTNSRLVVEVKLGNNPEYAATRAAVESGLRIDAIRGLARANIDKLVAGEPITIEGVDGSAVEIQNPEALGKYANDAVATYIQSLPANYVMQNAAGQYVPIQEAFNEARSAARTNPVTWKEFGDRMFRTAGSSAPLSSVPKAA